MATLGGFGPHIINRTRNEVECGATANPARIRPRVEPLKRNVVAIRPPFHSPGVPVCRDPTNFAQDCRIFWLELSALFYRSLGDSGSSSILSVLSLGLDLVMAAFRALSSCSAFSLAAMASALSELARACSLIDAWLCGACTSVRISSSCTFK